MEVEVNASTSSSLSSFGWRAVVVRESSGTLHLADDGVQRAVGVLWRAEIAQSRMRLRSNAFQHCSRQSRLADTRLARDQHHLAVAGLCLQPAPHQQFEFFVSPDKLGQPLA